MGLYPDDRVRKPLKAIMAVNVQGWPYTVAIKFPNIVTLDAKGLANWSVASNTWTAVALWEMSTLFIEAPRNYRADVSLQRQDT